MDWNSLSEFSQGAVFFLTIIVAMGSPAFFREYCAFDIWPGVVRQTIAIAVFVILQSNKSKIDYPELLIGIIIVLTVITLYVNIRECGAVAGTGALLSQLIIGAYVVFILALLLAFYAIGRGGRKSENH